VFTKFRRYAVLSFIYYPVLPIRILVVWLTYIGLTYIYDLNDVCWTVKRRHATRRLYLCICLTWLQTSVLLLRRYKTVMPVHRSSLTRKLKVASAV